MAICRRAWLLLRWPRNGVFGTYFFHLLPFVEQDTLYRSALGSVPFPPPDGPTAVYYPGNNNVYSQPVKLFLCPSDPSVGPDGVVSVDGFSFGASCYAPNALVIADRYSPPHSAGQERASPTSPTALSNTILHAEKYARCTNTPWHRRSGTAARLGVLHGLVFPWQPPPMMLPGKAFQPGFAIAGLGGPRAPRRHWPRVDLSGPAHSVSGQLRSDAGLDGSPRRHAGWPGRRQRPHAGPEHERRHLVGGRDALGGRSAWFGLVKLVRRLNNRLMKKSGR